MSNADGHDCAGAIGCTPGKCQFEPAPQPAPRGDEAKVREIANKAASLGIVMSTPGKECKTCGCTGGNGSWFVRDSKGVAYTTERCPNCRIEQKPSVDAIRAEAYAAGKADGARDKATIDRLRDKIDRLQEQIANLIARRGSEGT